MIPLRLILVATDLLSAAALAAAVVLVAPGELSRTYALIVIATSVVPGLMLTGDVKMLNAGVGETVSHLRSKVVASVLLNLPIGFSSAWVAVSSVVEHRAGFVFHLRPYNSDRPNFGQVRLWHEHGRLSD